MLFHISYSYGLEKGWEVTEKELPIKKETKYEYHVDFEGTDLIENWIYLRGKSVLKQNKEWSYQNGNRVLGYLNYHGDLMSEYFEVDVVTIDKDKSHEEIKKIINEIAEKKMKRITDRLSGLNDVLNNK